jgi:hypothetical protein
MNEGNQKKYHLLKEDLDGGGDKREERPPVPTQHIKWFVKDIPGILIVTLVYLLYA